MQEMQLRWPLHGFVLTSPSGGRLRLCFLPGYAPELNPDECVWQHVKDDRIGRAGVADPEDLKAKGK